MIHTDGWKGYNSVSSLGYTHEITVLKGKKESASELLPRVHMVISLLKRWLVGTHHGAVSHKHLGYYLDEFTFRFNRRKSILDSAQFDLSIRQRSPLNANEYRSACIGRGFSSVWGPIGKMRKIAGWRNAERSRPPTPMAGEPGSWFGASF